MKVKKWLPSLVTFAAMVVICAVCASAETYGDFEYDVLDDGTVEITDYNGSAEKVDIPAEIDGKKVTEIGRFAFANKYTLTSVTIPDSVTSIGESAFNYCTSLTSVKIPNSVTSIGGGAFEQCVSLTNIEIPSSVTSIDWEAFSGCTNLKSVTIPDSVTSIGGGAFEQCTNLTNIVIPNGVTEIGGDAFRGCTSLTGITIPDGMMSIGKRAFWECKSLKTVTIPDSVTSIGIWAFRNCISLTAINVATENQNYVSVNGVLYNNDKTTIICYPAGKKDESYKIINGVTSIEGSAFKDCISLKSVTIPDSMTSLGDGAFEDCISLTSITIPGSVTSIGESAFNYCTSLTSVEIPNSVTSIGGWAFYDCTSLTSITIPNSVRSIGRGAFTNTALLENQTTTIKYVDKWVVDCDYDVRSVTIKNGTVGVANMAFYGCENLASITVPDSVTSICESAFKDCTSLTSITIPNSVMNIDDYTFSGCRSLTSVTIPNGVTYIGNEAFRVCTSLTGITLPDSVTSIGNSAFEWCESLTSIKISNSVVGIGSSAFADCTSLTSITIPNGVTSIGDYAFYGCTSLTSITIPKNVTSIGNNALGYSWSDYYSDDVKSDNFKIYCYSNTAGEQYAKDNGFAYELLDQPTIANVTGFKVKSIFSTNVTLQWSKNANASGYEIEQYKGGKWVNVAKITSNATTSYTVKGLAAGTAGYKFRMRAVKDGAYSDYTSALTVNTNPYGVGGFKCSSKSSTSVTLKWNKGTTASGYQLQQYKDGKWVTIYTGTKATNTSYTVKGLKAGTAGYRFRIRAYKTYGNTKQYGSWSSEVKVNTNPYGVGGFKAKSISSTSITLQWNKGTTASGYQLQQYKSGKWVTIYTGTKATSTSYTVKNLKAGTAGYRFRIRAYKTYGNTKQYGSWSSEVKVNTNPYGVGGFKAKSTAKTSITLGWNKGTTASGYQLQQYKGGKWVTVYTGTKATSTSCTIKSLKANTSYKFRIRAYKTYGNAKQYGSWSKELTVKTKR